MKLIAATIASLMPMAVFAKTDSRAESQAPAGATESPGLEIKRNGSRPSTKGPAASFTGAVRVDPLFPAETPSRTSGGTVTFEPGARTAWHTHPLGQTLVVTAGFGWVQRWGALRQEIRPGDVVWIPPGVKHWHGASPTTGMTHIAIQEHQDGKVVDWLEQVSDEQYEK